MAELQRTVKLPEQYRRVRVSVYVTTPSTQLSVERGAGVSAAHRFELRNKTPHDVDVVALGRLEPFEEPSSALVDLAAYIELLDRTSAEGQRLSYTKGSVEPVWVVPLTKALPKTPYSPAADFWHDEQACADGTTHTVSMEFTVQGGWNKAVPVTKRVDVTVTCHPDVTSTSA